MFGPLAAWGARVDEKTHEIISFKTRLLFVWTIQLIIVDFFFPCKLVLVIFCLQEAAVGLNSRDSQTHCRARQSGSSDECGLQDFITCWVPTASQAFTASTRPDNKQLLWGSTPTPHPPGSVYSPPHTRARTHAELKRSLSFIPNEGRLTFACQ